MTEPERLTGDQAREAIASLREKEVVVAAEGGEGWIGEDDEAFYFFYPGFAFELPVDDEDLSPSALRFPDRESRDAYLREGPPMEALRARGWLVCPPGFTDNSALGVGGQLLAASADWLKELSETDTECGSLDERDFQKALLGCLEQSLSVRQEVGVQGEGDEDGPIPGWNPGRVDLIADADNKEVWIELKWAKEAKTLSNCLWDAAKLAGAIRSKAATVGYLVAGAPASEWEKDHPYQGLFTFHSWEGRSIVEDPYRSSWLGWLNEKERTFPSEIVDPIQVLPFGYVRGGPDDWEVRVARITAPGSATISTTRADLESA